ncbi:MAG: glycosyl transferase family 2 [Chloroflexi bacterium]|nr:glycosyl transferase family 2 [Chloroflexota bacterium]
MNAHVIAVSSQQVLDYRFTIGHALTVAWQHIQTYRQVLPIGVVGLLSWSVWLFRRTLSRFYRPTPVGYRTTTSVVVPAYREDPDIVERCLRSWLAENPTEVIVVPDLADREVIARLRAVNDPRVRIIPFAHQGKRSALGVAIRAASSEVLVLTDSDTEWLPGLLASVQAPFADPKVGGVGTQQNVYQAKSSVWRRVADWMIDVRYLDYVPSQARKGAVACLSGRTAAYRRSAVMPVLGHLEHEFFLGRFCVSGDDGRLTWLILGSGYRTVHQSTALTLSMFPDGLRAFLKQRVRWSRNSYRCYITAMWKGWLWRQPIITQLSVLQIMLTPVTMTLALTYLVHWFFHPEQWVATIAIGWLLVGRALRGLSHLRRRPSDILILPLVAFMTVFIALPVKTFAFVTMNRQGWLTRRSDMTETGGEGQSAASLEGAY